MQPKGKEREEEKEKETGKENIQEKGIEKEVEKENQQNKENRGEAPGILTESSRNVFNLRCPEISFVKDSINTTVSSPKFLYSENRTKQKEAVKPVDQRAAINKAMSMKRKGNTADMLTSSSFNSMSYSINASRDRTDLKAPRKI